MAGPSETSWVSNKLQQSRVQVSFCLPLPARLVAICVFFYKKNIYRPVLTCHAAAAKFGSPPPVPFLSLYMTDDEVLGGVNFASGGAGLLNETGIYFVS